MEQEKLEMKEIRILLTEQDFAKLCEIGFVEYQKLKIPISEKDFDILIEGGIAQLNHQGQPVKIALQDIGYNRIAMYLSKSKIY